MVQLTTPHQTSAGAGVGVVEIKVGTSPSGTPTEAVEVPDCVSPLLVIWNPAQPREVSQPPT